MKKITLISLVLIFSINTNALAKPNKPRIIALAPHIVEMLFSIGAGEQIIATTEHSDYPLQAKAIPRVGNYARLQIEQILALKPDLVIAWKTGNPSDDLQRLEKLGLNIVYSQPNQLQDVASELRMFAKLSGKLHGGEPMASLYEQRLKALAENYEQKTPVTVFYELWSQPLTTIAGNAWPQQVLALCQVTNPFVAAANDYPQIGLEQVIVVNPDIIIQPRSAGEVNKNAVNWQRWPQLHAVKREAIIHPDADQLHRMTPRVLDEADRLCQQIDALRPLN